MGFYNDWAYYLRYGFKPHDDAIDSLRYVFMTKSQKEQKGMGIEMSGGMPKTAAEQTAELVGALEKDLNKERDLREDLEIKLRLLRSELGLSRANEDAVKKQNQILAEQLFNANLENRNLKAHIQLKQRDAEERISSLRVEVIRLEEKLRDSQANYELVRKQLNRQADEEIKEYAPKNEGFDDNFFHQYGEMSIKGNFTPFHTSSFLVKYLYDAFEERFRKRNTPIDANGNPGNWEVTK